MLKGIREDDKFAKETALTDEFKHTILHTDSLYTLMTRMTNPVHNVRAVLVALREIGFNGMAAVELSRDSHRGATAAAEAMQHLLAAQS